MSGRHYAGFFQGFSGLFQGFVVVYEPYKGFMKAAVVVERVLRCLML